MAVPFLIAALPAAAPAQEPVLLRMALPLGQTTPYHVTIAIDVDITGTAALAMNMAMEITQTVVDVTGEIRTLDLVIDTAAVDGLGGMLPASMLERMIGERLTVRMDTRGRTLEAEMPPSLEQPFLGGAQFQQGLAQVSLPEDPVAPGATWPDSSTTATESEAGSMTLRRDLRYRFERLETVAAARHAVLSVTGQIHQQIEVTQGREMVMTSDGSTDGEIVIDLDAGRFVRFEMEMTMLMDAPMLSAPATTGMRMTVAIAEDRGG